MGPGSGGKIVCRTREVRKYTTAYGTRDGRTDGLWDQGGKDRKFVGPGRGGQVIYNWVITVLKLNYQFH